MVTFFPPTSTHRLEDKGTAITAYEAPSFVINNTNMRIIIFTHTILLLSSTSLLSQKVPNTIRLYCFPIGFQVNKNIWDENGEGVYKIETNTKVLSSIGAVYNWNINNSLSFDFGLGIRQVKYNFDYIIHDPFNEEIVLDRVNRHHNQTNLSPSIGMSFYWNQFRISLSYELNAPLFINENIETYYGPIEFFFDPITQQSAYYEIIERNGFTDYFARSGSPSLSLSYKFSPKFSLLFTGLIKPKSSIYLYQLDIKGKTPEMPTGNYQLNDTKLKNNYIILYLGVEYKIK